MITRYTTINISYTDVGVFKIEGELYCPIEYLAKLSVTEFTDTIEFHWGKSSFTLAPVSSLESGLAQTIEDAANENFEGLNYENEIQLEAIARGHNPMFVMRYLRGIIAFNRPYDNTFPKAQKLTETIILKQFADTYKSQPDTNDCKKEIELAFKGINMKTKIIDSKLYFSVESYMAIAFPEHREPDILIFNRIEKPKSKSGAIKGDDGLTYVPLSTVVDWLLDDNRELAKVMISVGLSIYYRTFGS